MKPVFFLVGTLIVSIAQAQVPSVFPTPYRVASATTDSKWVQSFGEYLSRRLTLIYGGTEALNRILESGTAIRGVLGISGNALTSKDEIIQGIPFQIEINSDGTKSVSVGVIRGAIRARSNSGVKGAFNLLQFTYDDRYPGKLDRNITILGADLYVPVTRAFGGRFSPRGTLSLNSRNVTYQNPRQADQKLVVPFGYALDAKAGVNFDRSFLDYSLNLFAGYQFIGSGSGKNLDVSRYAQQNIETVQIISQQVPIEMSFLKSVGKQDRNRIGIFYQGFFARNSKLRGSFSQQTWDITRLELAVPHRAGIRFSR